MNEHKRIYKRMAIHSLKVILCLVLVGFGIKQPALATSNMQTFSPKCQSLRGYTIDDSWAITPDDSSESYKISYSIANLEYTNYTNRSITLTFKNYGNNSGFYIYRYTQYDDSFVKIATIQNPSAGEDVYSGISDTIRFTDTDFCRGLAFYYRVYPYQINDDGSISTQTNYLYNGFRLKLAQPSISKITCTKTKATITWSKVTGADGYQLQGKKTTASKYKTIKTTTKTKYAYSGNYKKYRYKFKVRAYVTFHNHTITTSYCDASTTSLQSTFMQKVKKLMKKYPDGQFWNHVGKSSYSSSTTTKKPCPSHTSLSTCNHYECPNNVIGYQCYGFAWKMSDLIYGKSAKVKKHYSFKKCKAGDVIRYQGHSVFVIEKHTNYCVVGECNYGNTCKIKWGRKIYKSELSGATYSYRVKK